MLFLMNWPIYCISYPGPSFRRLLMARMKL